jgi:hypothetical protein
MLWYKAWLETRWRMLAPLGMMVFVLAQSHAQGSLELRPGRMLDGIAVFWLIAPIMLAGTGVKTESTYRPMKGLNDSIYFTLSLPVSRVRLLAVRAGVGLAEICMILVTIVAVAGVFFPELRTQTSPTDVLKYAFTALACSLLFYGLSALLSAYFDQVFQVWGSMFALFALRWLSNSVLPQSLNIFQAIGSGSPLVTHSMPWGPILFAFALGVFLLSTAAYLVLEQEF